MTPAMTLDAREPAIDDHEQALASAGAGAAA
jgi:hypothetical protein